MEVALRALLVAYAPLTALVGSRITWNEIPQGAADPNVSLFNILPGASYTYAGPSSLRGALVQINVRAQSFASAVAVRDAIEARLSGFKGAQGGVEFGGIFLRSVRSAKEKPTTVEYHTFQMDFEVWHQPA
jgi:hypothetical protein